MLIFVQISPLHIEDSLFTENNLHFLLMSFTGTHRFRNCKFANNNVYVYILMVRIDIYLPSARHTHITNCSFISNIAGGVWGTYYFFQSQSISYLHSVQIRDSLFANNKVDEIIMVKKNTPPKLE